MEESARHTINVLQFSFLHPSLFNHFIAFVKGCYKYQSLGTILKRHEMPLSNIFEVEFFMCGVLTLWVPSRHRVETNRSLWLWIM